MTDDINYLNKNTVKKDKNHVQNDMQKLPKHLNNVQNQPQNTHIESSL